MSKASEISDEARRSVNRLPVRYEMRSVDGTAVWVTLDPMRSEPVELWRADFNAATPTPVKIAGSEWVVARRHAEDVQLLLAALTAQFTRADALAEQLAGLPEWRCPDCGAVVRARMADHVEVPPITEADGTD
jgi:hypothetical protein